MPVRKSSKISDPSDDPLDEPQEKVESMNEENESQEQEVMQEPAINTEESEKTIFVPMNEQKIREMAFQNSQKKMSFNELVWYVSENDVRLKNAIPADQNPLLGKKVSKITIDLNKIVRVPSQEDVKKVAQTMASFRPNLPDLNWNLAVRQYIFENIKNKF
jgi:hypothetical protein